jgi:hypothetical protein
VWREMNTSYPTSGRAASKTVDRVPRVWARATAGEV